MSLAALLKFVRSPIGGAVFASAGLALAIWLAVGWHGARSNAAIDAAVKAALNSRDAAWQASFNSMKNTAAIWKRRTEDTGAQLAEQRRQAHEDELRRIGADADALRLRGPGQATARAGCRSGTDPVARAAAGGPAPAVAGTDAPGPGLPAPDRDGEYAIVPWGWLVRRAEEHDALLSEANAWRHHDAEQRQLLDGARADLQRRLDAARPAFGSASGAAP